MNLWEREWNINSDPEDVFLEAGSETFAIKKNGLNGGSTFDVHFNGNGMPAEWNDCSLVARGIEPFKLIGDPLPKFDESAATRNKYNEAIKAALLTTTTSTRRPALPNVMAAARPFDPPPKTIASSVFAMVRLLVRGSRARPAVTTRP